MNRVLLFLLIACPISIGIYSTGNDSMSIANSILKNVGGFFLLSWCIGISLISKEQLKRNNINLNEFNFLVGAIFILIASQMFLLFTGNHLEHYNVGIINLTKPTNIIPQLLSTLAFVFIIITSAKALVSAEQNKEVALKEYFKTFLLIVFSIFGLWSVQPRIQKISN